MVLGTIFSENIALNVENRLYRDKIILNKQTKYQKIVVTKHKDDLRLYINGNIQFSTIDEYRYHESLVHIPMSVSEDKSKILILGGGDGLAVREVLKYEEVDKITLVDLDKEMVELSQNNKEIRKVNNDSLNSDKLKIVYEDAFEYLENSNELFNIILVDLPDPNDENLNKLYTNIFYRLVSNRLDKDGVISIQSTSPYYAKEAFWCINKTLEEEGLNVIPYHVEVPSFGDWGFQLASKKVIEKEKIKINVETKFLNNESIDRLFMFSEDEIVDKDKLITNTIARPQLINYYLKAIENWR